MGRPERVHYLRRNEGERTPRRLLVFDTETASEPEEAAELHRLRLWSALHVIRHPGEEREPDITPYWGRTAGQLAQLAEQVARTSGATWCYAHNLSFDLTTTRLPLELLARGWQLGQHNLASEAPWARLKRGNRRLRLADSFSWLPVSVQTLGELMGVEKPALPEQDDCEETWLERCRADVAITTAALLRLMAEWDRLALGHWSLTGSASGWNSMLHLTPRQARHRFDAPAGTRSGERLGAPVAPVVISPDPVGRALEREAIYSGRRDVWRHGELPPEHYAELDFRSAHLAVAMNLPLPDRRSARFSRLALEDWHWDNPTRTMVARCRVRVRRPRYPFRWRGSVLHPVGEFWTVLAGPELREARARGELLEVGEGYSYRLGRFMQPWAGWCWDVLYGPEGRFDPLLQVAVKDWSRKVPGRWAMMVTRELARRPTPHLGWHVEPAAFGDPPAHGHVLWMAGERVELVRDKEAEDSFPAVLAHIQSWARLLQARMIDRLTEAAVVQVNTDSALVAVARLEELARERWQRLGAEPELASELMAGAREVSEATAPLEARVKAVARGGRVLSAQHVEHAGARKFAGVPRSAVEVEPGVYQFLTWPKLRGQMERGDPRGYVRELRRIDLRGLTVNRWMHEDGCCEPVRAAVAPDGRSVLLPAGSGGCAAHGAPLRELQHPTLRGLVGLRD